MGKLGLDHHRNTGNLVLLKGKPYKVVQRHNKLPVVGIEPLNNLFLFFNGVIFAS